MHVRDFTAGGVALYFPGKVTDRFRLSSALIVALTGVVLGIVLSMWRRTR